MVAPSELFQGLNITFNITEDCNLRCKYCYELDKRPGDLPLPYAKKFIDLILDTEDPIGVNDSKNDWMLNTGLILDFIGGDALMRPQLCESILEYYMMSSTIRNHKWAYRWRSSISTNGTLFREPGVKQFLNRFKENISLGVSVDGCPEIHNMNRDNSMAALLQDWDYYVQYSHPYTSTKSTLNKDSIPFLFKSLKFLHESLGLMFINMNFIFEPMGDTDEDWLEFDRQMEKCIPYVLDHRKDIHWSLISKDFGRGTCMKDPDKGWCGAGSMPCLCINGKIYPCFRFMPHTMSSRDIDFHVGDIWNGFDHKERFQTVRDQCRSKISTKECMECPVESNCAWCIGGAFADKGTFYRPMNICKAHKATSKWAEIYWKEFKRLEGHEDYYPNGIG